MCQSKRDDTCWLPDRCTISCCPSSKIPTNMSPSPICLSPTASFVLCMRNTVGNIMRVADMSSADRHMLYLQEAAAGGSGDHAMHRQRPSTAAVHGRQTGAAAHMDDAQPSLRQGQARPLQPTTQRGGGNLPVHVVRPSTAQPRLAPGVTRQGAAPAPFTERQQRPSSAMGTHPKREAVTKAGHPPKRPTSAMGNQHSAQAPSQSGKNRLNGHHHPSETA